MLNFVQPLIGPVEFIQFIGSEDTIDLSASYLILGA